MQFKLNVCDLRRKPLETTLIFDILNKIKQTLWLKVSQDDHLNVYGGREKQHSLEPTE